jgi:hypothetical protein
VARGSASCIHFRWQEPTLARSSRRLRGRAAAMPRPAPRVAPATTATRRPSEPIRTASEPAPQAEAR